jgi:hypothetical protein
VDDEGNVILPTAPGLGMELNGNCIDDHRVAG